MKLLIGNPTGHEDQYQCTLLVGKQMLRGPLSLKAIAELKDVATKGCRATGREFNAASLTAARRQHAPTE